MRKEGRETEIEAKGDRELQRGERSLLLSLVLSNFRDLRVYRKSSISPPAYRPQSQSSSLSPFSLAEFSTYARRKTHAENVCTRTRSTRFATLEIPCTPLPPASPSVSHPPHLSSTITPSPPRPPRPLFLSFARTHARRCCLSSFFLPLSGSL